MFGINLQDYLLNHWFSNKLNCCSNFDLLVNPLWQRITKLFWKIPLKILIWSEKDKKDTGALKVKKEGILISQMFLRNFRVIDLIQRVLLW